VGRRIGPVGPFAREAESAAFQIAENQSIGSGYTALLDYLEALASKLGANVEFLGFVSDDDLGLYYSRARALLFPGVEDFGIVPVEAIAAGCPVIALGEGGILDSMTDRTAVFYSEGTIGGLQRAIAEFEGRSFDPAELRNHAQTFSVDAFVNGFQRVLAQAMRTP